MIGDRRPSTARVRDQTEVFERFFGWNPDFQANVPLISGGSTGRRSPQPGSTWGTAPGNAPEQRLPGGKRPATGSECDGFTPPILRNFSLSVEHCTRARSVPLRPRRRKASSKRYESLFFKPIFHLPPSTVHLFVERLGGVRKIRHKKPWVLALCAMLGFGHHPAGAFRFRHPGYRQISGLAQAQAPAAGLFWASPSGQFRQFRESYIAFKIP